VTRGGKKEEDADEGFIRVLLSFLHPCRPLERMNSPLEIREVRLRGL
jgi:hypothetical protein